MMNERNESAVENTDAKADAVVGDVSNATDTATEPEPLTSSQGQPAPKAAAGKKNKKMCKVDLKEMFEQNKALIIHSRKN